MGLLSEGVHVRRVNFGRLTGGILHSKFWIVDRKHVFIGSPNMDWRALTQVYFNMCKYAGSINTCWAVSGNASFFQVKELGVVIYNCSSLAKDLHKIFQSYWVMGQASSMLPQRWPAEYDAAFNKHLPLLVKAGNVSSRLYLTVSFSCFTGHHSSVDSGLKNFLSFEPYTD